MARVRKGTAPDVAALREIYNHYVLNAIATADTESRSLEDRLAWFHNYAPQGPHRLLVAESDEAILGYATSSPYRPHPAFSQTVELSVYLDPSSRGKGVGTALYGSLLEELTQEPVHLAVAAVALPNPASVALHRRFGFREIGIFTEYFVKNGQYVSSMWFERKLQEAPVSS